MSASQHEESDSKEDLDVDFAGSRRALSGLLVSLGSVSVDSAHDSHGVVVAAISRLKLLT